MAGREFYVPDKIGSSMDSSGWAFLGHLLFIFFFQPWICDLIWHVVVDMHVELDTPSLGPRTQGRRLVKLRGLWPRLRS